MMHKVTGIQQPKKAYKGYYYKKNRQAIEEKLKESSRLIDEWLKQNPSFQKEFEDELFISLKDGDPSYVKDFLKEYNAPFTLKEYEKYIDYKDKRYKRKKRKK